MAIATYQKPLLALLGCGIILFSLILIGCSFDINYDDDFQADGADELEARVRARFNYYQYWAGIPFVITGGLVLFLANNRQSEALAVITLIFCVVSMGLTLLVLSLSSFSFSAWHTLQSMKLYWESKGGYSCSTEADNSCQCTNINGKPNRYISDISCGTLSKLSGLYGSLVVSSIIIAVCCVFSVIITTKFSLQQKPYIQFRDDDSPVNRTVAIAPSFVELPVATR